MNECATREGCPLSRKRFLLLAAAAATAATAGCESAGLGLGAGTAAVAGSGATIDAGPAAAYAADGVYANFLNLGFFLVRKNGRLIALSSYCPHRHCKLTAEPDRSYYCDCHGSTFDPDGQVTHGPATQNLPQLTLTIDARSHVLVKVV